MKPEDFVLRVRAELDSGEFNGNFNDVALHWLFYFLKAPRDGVRAMLPDMKLHSFNPAYEIAHYEVVKALEQKIAVEQSWIDDLVYCQSDEIEVSIPLKWKFDAIAQFLKKLPRWNGMDINVRN